MTPFLEPLLPEEETRLLLAAKNNDLGARNQLVERNLRLVAHIVKKYASSEREQEDLISVGTIGLLKAVQTFDVEKGNKLVTYAAKCIENEILMMLRAEKKKSRDVSMFEPIGVDKEGNSIRLVDIMEDEAYDVVEEMEKKENIRWLRQHLTQILQGRERDIILMRYGFATGKICTQREIAAKFKISRSYVSRIEKKALKKLRMAMEDQKNV